jgi:ATP-dependent DNA helicase PIF1
VDFVHTSAAWAELRLAVCYLSEQHRQAGGGLLDVLEAMRRGTVAAGHRRALLERLGREPADGGTITRLCSHNVDVDTINDRHLAALRGDITTYVMAAKGSSASQINQLAQDVLAPRSFDLKIGAEVMFIANNLAGGYVNGSRGRVTGFRRGLPRVRLENSGRTFTVEPYSWTLTEDGRTRAEVVQLPLRLAWAMTIHKSQGMSLDAAEIDLGKAFMPGMGYVALSRVRSLDGVYLSGLNRMAMQVSPDVIEFDKHLRQASAALEMSPPAHCSL